MATAAVSGSLVNSRPPELVLKSVFGTGREGRWETVQQLFHEQIEPLYGSQGHLLKKLPESETLKTRLLVAEKNPVGVLVYQTAREDSHQKELGRYLEIKILHGHESRPEALPYLLDHLLELAKEHHSDSLCVRTPKQAPLVPFLEKNRFQALEERNGLVLYSRKIENLSNDSRKRKAEDDGKEEKLSSPTLFIKAKTAEAESKKIRLRPPDEPRPFPMPLPSTVDGIPKILSSKVLAENKLLLEKAKNEKCDNIPLKIIYLRMILEERKTIEGRINNGPFKNLKEGSFIRFFSQTNEAYCQVTKVNRYGSFAEMLQTEGVKSCLPDVHSLQEGIRIYDAIPGYADRAKKFGVLAIHIRVLK